MKTKNHNQLLKAFAAMAMLTTMGACSSDDGSQTAPKDNRIIILSNVLESGVTRASSTAHMATGTQFASGQNVDIFLYEDQAEGTIVTYSGQRMYLKTSGSGNFTWYGDTDAGRTGEATTHYWPASGNSVYFYAWYPAGLFSGISNTITTTTADQTVDIATDQGAADAGLATDLMFGAPAAQVNGTTPVAHPAASNTASETVNLAFKHCLTKVTVVLAAHVSMLDVTQLTGATITLGKDENGERLYTQATVSPNTGAAVAKTDGTEGVFTLKATGDAVYTAYCIIPPQNINGKKLTITLKNGGSYEYTITNPAGGVTATEMAGKEYKYSFTLGVSSAPVFSTVTDWNTTEVTEAVPVYI